MKSKSVVTILSLLAFGALVFLDVPPARSGEPEAPAKTVEPAPTTAEARSRARLLHTTLHGTLSVMHRDFFRKGDSRAIPSASLKDVFKQIAEEHGVTVRWLATEETVMNVDNLATDPWQQEALRAIQEGKDSAETTENGRYRFAGAIPLQNQCLKCHVATRTSLEDRFAALEISLPLRLEKAEE